MNLLNLSCSIAFILDYMLQYTAQAFVCIFHQILKKIFKSWILPRVPLVKAESVTWDNTTVRPEIVLQIAQLRINWILALIILAIVLSRGLGAAIRNMRPQLSGVARGGGNLGGPPRTALLGGRQNWAYTYKKEKGKVFWGVQNFWEGYKRAVNERKIKRAKKKVVKKIREGRQTP